MQFFHVSWYELRKYIFMKLFNRVNNKEVKTFHMLKPIMKNKRKQIKEITKISNKDILDWMK